jgi:hypothetical protein
MIFDRIVVQNLATMSLCTQPRGTCDFMNNCDGVLLCTIRICGRVTCHDQVTVLHKMAYLSRSVCGDHGESVLMVSFETSVWIPQ